LAYEAIVIAHKPAAISRVDYLGIRLGVGSMSILEDFMAFVPVKRRSEERNERRAEWEARQDSHVYPSFQQPELSKLEVFQPGQDCRKERRED
jgi:hypothetical protein